jgi:5-methylcytosine-specific restriction endonuclease McrA
MEFYTAQQYIDAHFKPGQNHEVEYPRLYAEWKAYEKVMKKQLLKADHILRLAGVKQTTPPPSSHAVAKSVDEPPKTHWWSVRHRLYTAQGGKCFWCCRELGEHWQVDHHLPRSAGGTKELSNLRALCISCNQRKGRLLPEEFAIIMTHDLL